MKKAQKLALEGRLYKEALEKIIKKAISKLDNKYSSLLSHEHNKEEVKKDLYIVISSNKGLCGSFNYYLLNFLSKNSNFNSDSYLVLGKKAADFLSRIKANVIADFSEQNPFIDNVSPVFELILKKYLEKDFLNIYIVYNKFISTSKFETKKEKILPIENIDEFNEEVKEEKIQKENTYLIEPSPEEIVDSVLKDLVKEKIKSSILNSEAAEYSARMLAMKNATDSATDIIDTLKLEGNKLRQNGITNELLDMISALQSSS